MTNDPKSCERCGQTHVACTSHRRDGQPCGQPPMRGQRVCRKHGGKAPQNLAAAERRLLERRALLEVETLGLPREVDPHTALLEELHRTAGAVEWLGAVVADLERSEVVWGRIRDKRGGEDAGVTYEARPHAYVALWQAERDRLVRVAKACHDAGIEERRVRVAEQAGQQLASAMRAVIDALFEALVGALGSDEAALEVVRGAWSGWVLEIVPRELRRLSGGEVAGS